MGDDSHNQRLIRTITGLGYRWGGEVSIATRILIEQLRWDEAAASSQRALQIALRLRDAAGRATSMQLHVLVMAGIGRLWEAGSVQEEVKAVRVRTRVSVHAAAYDLAYDQPHLALVEAAAALVENDEGTRHALVPEDQDGALLL